MERVYISLIHEFPKNVVSSQVVEYLELFDKSGLNFNLIFLVQIGEYVKGFRKLFEQKNRFAKIIKGSVQVFPVARDFRIASFMAAILILIFKLFKYRKADKIVIHTRGMFSAWVASAMKRIYKNIEYVYDIRADMIAEYEYYASKENVSQRRRLQQVKWFDRINKIAIENSSKILCVSTILKNRFIERYSIDPEKITVIPCLADGNRFSFKIEKRDKIRNLLGLNSHKVFVYSGGMGYWHCSEKLFDIIGQLMKLRKDIHYLILTPNVELAEKYAARYLPGKNFTILNAGRDEVGEYLCAADVALLLREKHPLNQVAAPTKFAEYLMSGLPVIISGGIGDYSSFISENNMGKVLDDMPGTDGYIAAFSEVTEKCNTYNKTEIAAAGYKNFAKVKYSDMMCGMYRNL